MKKLGLILLLLGVVNMVSCTKQQVGTTTGAAAGAGIGYAASGGTPLGTAVGAGAGGLIGHEVTKNQ